MTERRATRLERPRVPAVSVFVAVLRPALAALGLPVDAGRLVLRVEEEATGGRSVSFTTSSQSS